MSRRSKDSGSGGGEGSAMDMMSCLIGCLILILIGILLIIMVSQALIIVANPENMKLEYIQLSEIDAIKEDKAFPHGNTQKEPVYIDVHRDHIKFYPSGHEVPIREVDVPGSLFRQEIATIKKNKEEMYVILLVRPNAAKRARWLKDILFDQEKIDVGVDLVQSNAKISYDENASDTFQELQKKLREKEGNAGKPSTGETIEPAPATSGTDSSPFPGEGNSGN